MRRADKEPWKAAVLALAYPGLGHLYLGLWRRALVWLLVVAVASQLPVFVFSLSVSLPALSIESFMQVARSIPLYLPVIVLAALLSNAFDAYRLANKEGLGRTPRDRKQPEPTVRCPNCRKTLEDPELEFCQWCAEPLDDRP